MKAFLNKHHPEEKSAQAVMESNLGAEDKLEKSLGFNKLPVAQHEVQTAGPSLEREGNQFSLAIRNTDPNQTVDEANSQIQAFDQSNMTQPNPLQITH